MGLARVRGERISEIGRKEKRERERKNDASKTDSDYLRADTGGSWAVLCKREVHPTSPPPDSYLSRGDPRSREERILTKPFRLPAVFGGSNNE